MKSIYFMDFPVYRSKMDCYNKSMELYIENEMFGGADSHNEVKRKFLHNNPDSKSIFYDYLRTNYGGSWRYNEIIGYIRLHFLCTQIRGEYWAVTAKRIVKTRKKIIELKDYKLAPEIEIPNGAKNIDVYNLILDYILRCEKELKNRHIDTSQIKIIGPFVDWNALRDQE